MLVVISACQEENILETQNIEVENTIKVKNGILSFSNKATLKKMVEGLKKKEVEGRNAELSEYYDKGFKPLFPNYLENDPRLEEYYNFKKKRALKITEKRDPKGLYKKARQGKIPNFTGIDSIYEKPINPELEIDTSKVSLSKAVKKILNIIN